MAEVKPVGQTHFNTPGSFPWVCPPNVTSVCVLEVGAGSSGVITGSSLRGGKGANLTYRNHVPVVPGETYTVVVAESKNDGTLIAPVSSFSAEGGEVTTYEGAEGSTNTAPSYPRSTGYYAEGGSSATVYDDGVGISLGVNELGQPSTEASAFGVGGRAYYYRNSNGTGSPIVYAGTQGLVRIIWGEGREFPDTRTNSRSLSSLTSRLLESSSPLAVSNNVGERDGSIYYGNLSESGRSVTAFPDVVGNISGWLPNSPYRTLARRNVVPECDEGIAVASGTMKSLTYGKSRGVKNRLFNSVMGVTKGRSFLCTNGGIASTDLKFQLSTVVGSSSSEIRANYDLTVDEILFESETHFVVLSRNASRTYVTKGESRLLRVSKTAVNVGPDILVSGYFDAVYLGECRTNTVGGRNHCLAVLSSIVTSRTASTSNMVWTAPVYDSPLLETARTDSSADGGTFLHLLGIGDVANNTDYRWMLESRPLGLGLITSATRGIRGLKFKTIFDDSMAVRDSEGFVTRISYAGYIPELEEEYWNTSSPTGEVKLQQNFGINHIDLVGTAETIPTINVTHQQIGLSQTMLDLTWNYGVNTTANLDLGRFLGNSLLSGRAWRSGSKFNCFLVAGDFNFNQNHAAVNSPDVPLTVIQADIDENNNLSNISYLEFPGWNVPDATYELSLLSGNRKMVWFPELRDKTTVRLLDLRGETPAVYLEGFSEEFKSLGALEDKLLVVPKEGAPSVVEVNPKGSVSISFDKEEYSVGDTATLTLQSPSRVTVEVRLLGCCTLNRTATVTLDLNPSEPKTVDVEIFGLPSAHVITLQERAV